MYYSARLWFPHTVSIISYNLRALRTLKAPAMVTRDWWRTQMEVNTISFYENRCNQGIVERWFQHSDPGQVLTQKPQAGDDRDTKQLLAADQRALLPPPDSQRCCAVSI
ncbi:hypothetical protein K503DRAFT_776773 [Rhizopogon vinicolor AM-OR11-026]|uniref:Uncharacterized protein n=1 Tax=Rhizopogon vinicolor AM-OR11-026 TaxID=1314800 RepID=A0A1B7MI94_9AGAM|nr:hypothetical protein K503DRAFT_776773 [Rhizopogon vinicolor AM-OR11-026]